MGRVARADAAQEAGQYQLPEHVASGDLLKRDVAISDGFLAINEPEANVCGFRETDLIEEQRFLIDWERGLITELCHYVRVRQIYRASVLPKLQAIRPGNHGARS
jgi:hypothetical protein